MYSKKYLILIFSVICFLQISIGVEITPSQQLPTELFKPIKPNSGASNTNSKELEVDNTQSSGSPTNPSPQTFNNRQQGFRQQGFRQPDFRQDQIFNRPEHKRNPGFHAPEVIRHNNYFEVGNPLERLNIPDINQNGFEQRTYTVPGTQNQPSYTVTSYQSPTYHQTWSWSSDGSRMENFSSDGPIPSSMPNGFGMNDISFDNNFGGDGFNNMPLGQTGTFSRRSGYHTVRTTGPDGRTREKTTVW